MKKFIAALILVLIPLSSQALFEVRAGYGVNSFDENYGGVEHEDMKGINFDLVVQPPTFDSLSLGLRYEMLTFDTPTIPAIESDLDRLSFLLSYRFIDLFFYAGLIGTYGISSDLETDGGAGTLSWDDKTNYTLGAEAGVNLGLISVGAEIGKFFGKFEAPATPELDLESFYAKILVGFGF